MCKKPAPVVWSTIICYCHSAMEPLFSWDITAATVSQPQGAWIPLQLRDHSSCILLGGAPLTPMAGRPQKPWRAWCGWATAAAVIYQLQGHIVHPHRWEITAMHCGCQEQGIWGLCSHGAWLGPSIHICGMLYPAPWATAGTLQPQQRKSGSWQLEGAARTYILQLLGTAGVEDSQLQLDIVHPCDWTLGS